MMHCSFDGRIELDNVYSEACTLCERAELVIDRLHLNSIKRDKGSLSGSLVAHVLE
jgi:hypothetical protein